MSVVCRLARSYCRLQQQCWSGIDPAVVIVSPVIKEDEGCKFAYRLGDLFDESIKHGVAELFIVQIQAYVICTGKTQPLAIVVLFLFAVVDMVLVGLRVFGEDVASVQEAAVDFEIFGEVFDQVDGLSLNKVLLSSLLEDRASPGG